VCLYIQVFKYLYGEGGHVISEEISICHHWVAMMDVNNCVVALFLCHVLIKILVMNSIIDVNNSVLIKILVMSSIIDVKNSVLIEILVMCLKFYMFGF
jgi:hypothetical protein